MTELTTPAAPKAVRTLTIRDLEVLPPVPEPDPFRLINHYHSHARLSMAQSCAFMILAGFELVALKKSTKHGQWQTLFPVDSKNRNAAVFDFSIDSAQRYMGLAVGAKAHIQALRGVPIGDVPLSQLSADARDIVLRAAHKSGDGQTYQQLAWDWGLAKKHGSHSAKGGNNGGQAAPPTAEKAAQEAYALIVGPVVKALTMFDHEENGIPQGNLLTDAAIAELAGALVDFNQRLKAARAATKKPTK
jgi:hypothetical protein